MFKVALQKQNFQGSANLVFLLNEIAYPAYFYDLDTKEFEELKPEEKNK